MALPKIVSDPDVMGGEPCIEGTRVPVASILIQVDAGYSPEHIYAAYPTLPPGSVEAAIAWRDVIVRTMHEELSRLVPDVPPDVGDELP